MKEKLALIFSERIKFNTATGIDRIRPEKFEEILVDELIDIEKKVTSKTYKFRPYKELLIVKSRTKPPRMVSIPTVRDKLVMSWLLGEIAPVLDVKSEFIYDIISSIKHEIASEKVYFAKLDLTGFYDNINHELLISDLQKVSIDPVLMDLLIKSLKNPTAQINLKPETQTNSKGVPQGIPVSNILAGFFAKRIDDQFSGKSNFFYTRYVDDILILSESEKEISNCLILLKDKIRSCGLEVNEEKEKVGHLKDGLDFLGYSFKLDKKLRVEVRESSYKKHYLKLLKIFSTYKTMRRKGKGNLNRFVWDLNLKITGAILKKDRYGWLFFFSQIDEDNHQLYALDKFVDEQLAKLGLKRSDLKIKRFSRTFKEIRRNLGQTTYIPNFDLYDMTEKRSFLFSVAGMSITEIDLLGNNDVEYYFNKFIYREVKTLEDDVGSTS